MYRHVFAIAVTGCVLAPAQECRAEEGQKVDLERQLIFRVKGLT
jgi:hypothetical protein